MRVMATTRSAMAVRLALQRGARPCDTDRVRQAADLVCAVVAAAGDEEGRRAGYARAGPHGSAAHARKGRPKEKFRAPRPHRWRAAPSDEHQCGPARPPVSAGRFTVVASKRSI